MNGGIGGTPKRLHLKDWTQYSRATVSVNTNSTEVIAPGTNTDGMIIHVLTSLLTGARSCVVAIHTALPSNVEIENNTVIRLCAFDTQAPYTYPSDLLPVYVPAGYGVYARCKPDTANGLQVIYELL